VEEIRQIDEYVGEPLTCEQGNGVYHQEARFEIQLRTGREAFHE
jgi:hypothetical protein